jgi:hypothetical protein
MGGTAASHCRPCLDDAKTLIIAKYLASQKNQTPDGANHPALKFLAAVYESVFA